MAHSHPHSQQGANGHVHSHGAGGHAHHHHGPHGHAASARALKLSLALTVGILVLELVGAWLSNSLALLADAGHVLTDAGALGLSLFVAWLARQPGSQAKTYGYLRWEILAALINGATLLLISVWIIIEAISRFHAPQPVTARSMLVVAVAGLLVNAVAAWLLHGSRDGSLNLRGAYLHVLGDLLASAGTVVAAAIIAVTGWLLADPIASLVTTVLIVIGAWRLVRESVDVLLEAAPPHISLDEVRGSLERIPGVDSVHDLHVWTVTSGVVALSAHAVVQEAGDHQNVLEAANDMLAGMGIHHVTVQLECESLSAREPHLHP